MENLIRDRQRFRAGEPDRAPESTATRRGDRHDRVFCFVGGFQHQENLTLLANLPNPRRARADFKIS